MVLGAVLTWVREFYRRGLVDFAACKNYYNFLPLEQLEVEAEWLFGDTFKKLPITFIFPRCYAVFRELLERSTCSPHLSDTQRVQLINLAIKTKERIISRSHENVRQEVKTLIIKDCAKIKEMGRYKKASDIIRDLQTEFTGPFNAPNNNKPGRKTVMVHSGNTSVH